MHKETGIIMSGNHPRLILDRLKTQTRRTAGLNKINENPDDWDYIATDGLFYVFRHKYTFLKSVHTKCPYGQMGDRLWVRETAMTDSRGNLHYKADEPDWVTLTRNKTSIRIVWKPSIHMFKRDARIWLEITGLRAERVQEIIVHELDIKAEGIDAPMLLLAATFRQLWDSLNAKRGYGWDFNPWLWVISFKLLTER